MRKTSHQKVSNRRFFHKVKAATARATATLECLLVYRQTDIRLLSALTHSSTSATTPHRQSQGDDLTARQEEPLVSRNACSASQPTASQQGFLAFGQTIMPFLPGRPKIETWLGSAARPSGSLEICDADRHPPRLRVRRTCRLLLVGAALTCQFSLAAADPATPFDRFIGDWTLKNDQWMFSDSENGSQTVTIERHHTTCQALNTPQSLLCTVQAPGLAGHILWAHDPVTGLVHHLSSFGEERVGVGTGQFDGHGNLALQIRFASEGRQTWRHYRYQWVSPDEYTLSSTQYRANQSTDNYYGGTFVRARLQPEPTRK